MRWVKRAHATPDGRLRDAFGRRRKPQMAIFCKAIINEGEGGQPYASVADALEANAFLSRCAQYFNYTVHGFWLRLKHADPDIAVATMEIT